MDARVMTLVYDTPPFTDEYRPDQTITLEATTVSQFDTWLDRIHMEASDWPVAVYVGIAEADGDESTPALGIALGRDTSALTWRRDLPGPEGDWSETEVLWSWNDSDVSSPVLATNHGDDPAWKIIPIDVARQAAREFFSDPSRPPHGIRWQTR
jgi:hypothetical protein